MPVVLAAEREELWPSTVRVLGLEDVVKTCHERLFVADFSRRLKRAGKST